MNFDELVARYRSTDSVPPQPALDGLDRVDWSAVRDAHGPAAGVPALLRALTADDPDHRNYAAQALFETIWHQGTIFSATAAAVPFLYALLEADGPHDKAAVAVLLAEIADGEPPLARCERDPEEADLWRRILAKSGRSLEAEIAEGRRFVAEIRSQLARRLDLLVPYLRHPDPVVRVCVAVALGRLPEAAGRFLPDLESALRDETADYPRGVLQEVVGRLTG